ncbi:Vga family ABC-F type ribosomal protection protein [Virgibacillus soli]|uniref:Vga family ABC-F type ribosomal protection protein n=1 Tax=Paracerasibacillus soli TaxID=480284 RepID=UPI0035EB8134
MMLLEGQNMKHYVKDRLILDIHHLQIQQHDRIGLVGRNGSGKTTLLNILASNIQPDQGGVTRYTTSAFIPQIKRMDTEKSGGEVTQKYLNEAIVKSPGLLLADEPTTNLDTERVEWLEKQLTYWHGAFVIVSHDRAFLDALCTKIWELNEGQLKEYKGNYSNYKMQKELEMEQHKQAYETYIEKKKQLEEALQLREEKAARATKKPKKVSKSEAKITGAKPYFAKKQKKLQKNAKAIERRIDKLEKVEPVKELASLKMNIPHVDTIGNRIMIRVEDLIGKVAHRLLWENISFYIRGGDKLAIIGPNGCGKTTLVKKIINGELGITISPSVKIGYFSQNLHILDTDKSIIENVQMSSKQDETLIRTVLARLHFFRDDVYKDVKVLSGGERVKVALAKVFLSDINMLILDEPTNFLDIDAAYALESLLNEYAGTVIFVSHDRRFIENIATRILYFREKQIKLFEGTYKQYIQHLSQEKKNTVEDELLILETKISEVLGRLSIEPTEELEAEFQRLLKEKSKLI